MRPLSPGNVARADGVATTAVRRNVPPTAASLDRQLIRRIWRDQPGPLCIGPYLHWGGRTRRRVTLRLEVDVWQGPNPSMVTPPVIEGDRDLRRQAGPAPGHDHRHRLATRWVHRRWTSPAPGAASSLRAIAPVLTRL